VIVNHTLETTPLFRRGLADLLFVIDFALLSIPGIRRFGAVAVIYVDTEHSGVV